MVDDSFNERLTQLESALKVIRTIEANPELQAASFNFLFGNAAHTRLPLPAVQTAAEGAPGTGESAKKNGGGGKRAGKVPSVTQDKTLDIAPNGKKSWAAFVEEKQPGSLNEKNTAAVYWLLEEAELPRAGISQVVTLFIAAKWDLPANPRNSAQVAGSKGFLDTADADEIRLTSMGTALIVNDLPHSAKK